MGRHVQPFAAAVLVLFAIASVALFAGPQPAVLRGQVVDSSGGVLPGVTVTATSPDGRLLETVVSDGAGEYMFAALPAGPADLTFNLEGFDKAVVRVSVANDGDRRVAPQRLELAHLAETVVVSAKAPVLARQPQLPPPPPPPTIGPVPLHDPESVCGPAKADDTSNAVATVRALRRRAGRELYSRNDELDIEGGTLRGLEVGQNLVVRRYFQGGGATAAKGEHTSGLVQIVAVEERTSTAVVVYACDEMMKNDFLVPFQPEPIRAPEPSGVPAYYDAARILFADAGQSLGAPNRLMVIDRGSNHGVAAGQRVTIFRSARDTDKPIVLGNAIVVAVRGESATIRVQQATEPIWFGDLAAPQRQSFGARQTTSRTSP